MSLLYLLKLALKKGLWNLQVFGDLRLFISWMNDQLQVQNIDLLAVDNQMKHITGLFHKINFDHIFREHNMAAVELPKAGLSLHEEHYILIGFENGLPLPCRHATLDGF